MCLNLLHKSFQNFHSNIQDAFNETGLEILSPHYKAARDGSTMTVRAQYLPPTYVSHSFKVKIDKD
jgi:hypothetical protein